MLAKVSNGPSSACVLRTLLPVKAGRKDSERRLCPIPFCPHAGRGWRQPDEGHRFIGTLKKNDG